MNCFSILPGVHLLTVQKSYKLDTRHTGQEMVNKPWKDRKMFITERTSPLHIISSLSRAPPFNPRKIPIMQEMLYNEQAASQFLPSTWMGNIELGSSRILLKMRTCCKKWKTALMKRFCSSPAICQPLCPLSRVLGRGVTYTLRSHFIIDITSNSGE